MLVPITSSDLLTFSSRIGKQTARYCESNGECSVNRDRYRNLGNSFIYLFIYFTDSSALSFT